MSGSELLQDINDGIATLTINREERRNALSPSLIEALLQALEECAQNAEVHVVCLTGAGTKAFCSGADLMASMSSDAPPEHASLLYARLLQRLLAFPKPVLGRINGHAMGGGLGLALATDIAIAHEGVTFGTPEVKVGLFPMMIAPLILQNMPKKRAMQMILCGEKLSAQEALSFGMINEVVAESEFEQAIAARLAALRSCAPLAQQRGKQALREIENMAFEQAVEHLSGHLSFLMQTEDAAEGISAFFGKRTAQWKGR